MTDSNSIDGYVSDTLYPSRLNQALQPPWVDWHLKRRGFLPPRKDSEPFKIVDLGCGDGYGLVIAAASHPDGHFVGIDANPEHIARGQKLARDAGITNISLHCARFGDASDLATGDANYVTADGVLSWVSKENRSAVLKLGTKWLKQGGAFCLSYNCYPGWIPLTGFQKLVYALARDLTGSPEERFITAARQIHSSKILSTRVWDVLKPMLGRHPPAYFAHEYLNEHWEPSWSSDVVEAMAAEGMDFIGRLQETQIRKDFDLTAQQIDLISRYPDLASRELAHDQLIGNNLRMDIYVKPPLQNLEAKSAVATVLDQTWVLSIPPDKLEPYQANKEARELHFDDEVTQAIVEKLSNGPARLSEISGIPANSLIDAIDALHHAHYAIPVGPAQSDSSAIRVNRDLDKMGWPIDGLASAFGAFSFDRETITMRAPNALRRHGIANFD